MGDRERNEKGGDSLGGELDPKIRSGADAISSARNKPANYTIEENKGKVDPKSAKVPPKDAEDDRP